MASIPTGGSVLTIIYKTGDILKEDAEALVNPVNCVGVSGAGLAKAFRYAYPDNYVAYRSASRNRSIRLGHMFVFKTGQQVNPQYIVNFPTKRHWQDRSRIGTIKVGLTNLVREVMVRGIQSIAIPALGCGLGGLSWSEVKPLIHKAFEEVEGVATIVYEGRTQ